MTTIALFLVGSLRILVGGNAWLKNGLEMWGVGGLAPCIAYGVGFFN
jgi:hypothetical protein